MRIKLTIIFLLFLTTVKSQDFCPGTYVFDTIGAGSIPCHISNYSTYFGCWQDATYFQAQSYGFPAGIDVILVIDQITDCGGNPTTCPCIINIADSSDIIEAGDTFYLRKNDSTIGHNVGFINVDFAGIDFQIFLLGIPTVCNQNHPCSYGLSALGFIAECMGYGYEASQATYNICSTCSSIDTNLYFSICQGDSLFAGGNYQSITGVYYDTLSSIYSCDSIIITNLTVDSISRPTISLINDTLFSSSQSGNQWYDENGIIISATDNYFIPTITGDYYVIVSENNCSSDSSNVITFTTVGTTELQNTDNIFLFPNPVRSNLLIYCKTINEKYKLEIYNPIGQRLISVAFIDNASVDMSTFVKGLYIVKIFSDKYLIIKNIVKE